MTHVTRDAEAFPSLVAGLIAEAEAASAAIAGLRRDLQAAELRRRPDSRLAAVIERLAWLANHDELVVKVAEMQAHLVRMGYKAMPPGYASNALAALAERGMVQRHSYGRWRIHGEHPELVELRIRYIKGLVEDTRYWVADMKDAERLGHRRNLSGR